jgi:predicted amidohydrolase YtcJ
MMIQSEGTFALSRPRASIPASATRIRVGGIKFCRRRLRVRAHDAHEHAASVGTNDYGILTMTQEQIYEAVDDAHSHDFQIGIHANGDVTIDYVLKA